MGCGLSDPESQTAKGRSNTAPHEYAKEPETCVYWVTMTKIKRLIKSPLPPGPVSPVQQTQVDIWRQDSSVSEPMGDEIINVCA